MGAAKDFIGNAINEILMTKKTSDVKRILPSIEKIKIVSFSLSLVDSSWATEVWLTFWAHPTTWWPWESHQIARHCALQALIKLNNFCDMLILTPKGVEKRNNSCWVRPPSSPELYERKGAASSLSFWQRAITDLLIITVHVFVRSEARAAREKKSEKLCFRLGRVLCPFGVCCHQQAFWISVNPAEVRELLHNNSLGDSKFFITQLLYVDARES